MSTKKTLFSDVTEKDFSNMRRQQFMYFSLYEKSREDQLLWIDHQEKNIGAVIDNPEKGYGHLHHLGYQHLLYKEHFWLWMMDYTAGEDLSILAPRLEKIVDKFEEWGYVNRIFFEKLKKESPESEVDEKTCMVDFNNQLQYQDTLQLISVAVILRDAKSVRRIVRAMGPNRPADALYDEILSMYTDEKFDSIQTFHDQPYSILAKVFYEEDSSFEIKLVEKYLKNWYKEQKGARWYDAHLNISDDIAPYFGYWAFEAGAVCYVLDLIDVTIDSIFYPKDLVGYGRKLRSENKWTSEDVPLDSSDIYTSRCEAGQHCPRAGYWFTPAKVNSRQYFDQGKVMPDMKNANWITIWQWDKNQ